MAIKITTSINSGTKGPGGGSAIDSFLYLGEMFERMPVRMESAISRAALISKEQIESNIIKRGAAGKHFIVEVKKNGPFGLKVTIEQKISGSVGGTGDNSGYNPVIGSKIFFQSEMGYQGRRAFTSPKSGTNEGKRMKITRWSVGEETNIFSKVSVPPIGKFYFSQKNGVEAIPIKKMAFDTIYENINRNFNPIRSSMNRRGF